MATGTNSLNISSTGIIGFNATTAVFSESSVSQHDVLVGGAGGTAITSVSPSTSGFVLTSAGTGSDPSFQAVSASGAITTVDGDTGSMTPLSGVVTISGGSTGLTTTATSHTMDVTGTLNAGHGGSGLSTYTTYELLASGMTATGNYQEIPNSTSGYVLYSNGPGVLPSFQPAPSGLAWVDVTTGTQTVAPSTGYVTDNATQVTYSLPASPAFGNVFEITGGTSGSATAPWLLSLSAGQSVVFGNTTATTSVASTLQYDSAYFVCIADGVTVGSSVVFSIINSVGNLILT